MPKGNNIPFMPGAYPAPRGGTPTQKFQKHSHSVNSKSSRLAPDFPMGRASSGRKEDGKGAIQRAAKRRLFHNTSTAPGTAGYKRNM